VAGGWGPEQASLERMSRDSRPRCLGTRQGGGSGIRTRGASAQRFSRPPHSAALPSLRRRPYRGRERRSLALAVGSATLVAARSEWPFRPPPPDWPGLAPPHRLPAPARAARPTSDPPRRDHERIPVGDGHGRRAPPAVPTHPVAPGESLTWIAQCQLGDADRVNELIELNAELIDDPNIIQPGWQLVLPADASGACPEEPPARASARSSSSTPAEATSQDTPSAGHAGPGAGPVGQLVRRRRRRRSGGGPSLSQAVTTARCRPTASTAGPTSSTTGPGRRWAGPATPPPLQLQSRTVGPRPYRQRGSSPWPSCG
jgi:LysM repeat protein